MLDFVVEAENISFVYNFIHIPRIYIYKTKTKKKILYFFVWQICILTILPKYENCSAPVFSSFYLSYEKSFIIFKRLKHFDLVFFILCAGNLRKKIK